MILAAVVLSFRRPLGAAYNVDIMGIRIQIEQRIFADYNQFYCRMST